MRHFPPKSRCHACGGKTRGTCDTLCAACWTLVPESAKAEYLAAWRAGASLTTATQRLAASTGRTVERPRSAPRRFVTLHVSLVCSLLLLLAAPAVAQRLVVATPITKIAAYDSIYAVTATAFDALARRSPSSVVTWTVQPRGPFTVLPDSATKGQHATIAAQQIGASYAVATWKRSDGAVFRDSIRISVTPARVVAVRGYWAFHRLVSGGVGGDSAVTDPTPRDRCVYWVARDRRGGVLTGKTPSSVISDNPAVAIFVVGPGPLACTDTTVDPNRIVP